MNISNVMHQPIASPSAAPLVNHFAAPSALQTDLRASVFKPVGQVAQTQGQTANLNPGTVYSPLHNAVQAYGFISDVAASLVTYGANGKMTGPNGFLNSREDTNKVNADSVSAVSDLPDNIQAQAIDNRGEATGFLKAPLEDPIVATEQKEQETEQKIQDEIRMLAARDKEVRAHEQAHAAIGGAYAGAPKYQFEQGPNGVNYAIGGEVPIDVSPAATPEQTLEKAQTIRRAAMAPSEPSPQDRQVAQEAVQLEATARQQIAAERAQAATVKMSDISTHSPLSDDVAANAASLQNVNVSPDFNGLNLSEKNAPKLSENIITATKAANNVEAPAGEARGDLSLRVVSAYQISSLKPAAQNSNVNAFV